MVMQYKPKKGGRWRKYPGKNKIKGAVRDYDFRLLSSNKKKVLVKKAGYAKVLRRFRAIEFFKRH